MAKSSIKYTFGFALIVCVICSLALAMVSEGLRPKKVLNEQLDIKKNILKSVNLEQPLEKKATSQEIAEIYNQKIEEIVVNAKGEIVDGKKPREIKDGEDLYPVYIYKENSAIKAYSFPIIGKGLWSTLYGYLALEPDAKTVRGITYYKHGETPGLGAEIEKDWFQNNFKGKSVWNDANKELWPVIVIKGKVEGQKSGKEAEHYVDGISGATMTSKGVTEMIGRELNKYEPFFETVRK